jgi:hypothetical protein
MEVFWMRHCDVYPDIPTSDVVIVALDGSTIIGRVMQFEFGPEVGIWLWSMTVTRPRPLRGATNRRVNSRGEAGRCVVEAYERLMPSAW